MRRTYRSKKETGGVVDRNDLLQNLDERSSAFHAFFIQNIKQTKRELSCVGPSNPYGVGSKKVRKRKYVKRIVADVESPPQESMSKSAYLTPDKSIRVNKPLDPFDLLLNSSPATHIESTTNIRETVASKIDKFDQPTLKKRSKVYTHRRQIKTKRSNYSSSFTSDSDKENSGEHTNKTRNSSDIKAFNLIVEHEANRTPKITDDSINNVAKNMSILNKLNYKCFNDSTSNSFTYRKNRLDKIVRSPILQKSPLCSTPFKAKYRGESIYRFSPIPATHSPKIVLEDDIDKNDCNSSLILLKKDDICPKIPVGDDSEDKNDCNSSIITLKKDICRNINVADDGEDNDYNSSIILSNKDNVICRNITAADGSDNTNDFNCSIMLLKNDYICPDITLPQSDGDKNYCNSSIILFKNDDICPNITLAESDQDENDFNSSVIILKKDDICTDVIVTDYDEVKSNSSIILLKNGNIDPNITMTVNCEPKNDSSSSIILSQDYDTSSNATYFVTNEIINHGIDNRAIHDDFELEADDTSKRSDTIEVINHHQSIESEAFLGFTISDKHSLILVGDMSLNDIMKENNSVSENEITSFKVNVERLSSKEDSDCGHHIFEQENHKNNDNYLGDVNTKINEEVNGFEDVSFKKNSFTKEKGEYQNDDAIEVYVEYETDKEEINCMQDITLENNDIDKESLYDTCSSEQSSIQNLHIIEPAVVIKKMNDSSFLRYYEQMPDYGSDNTHSLINESLDGNDDFASVDSSSGKDKISDAETSEFGDEADVCNVLSSNEEDLEFNSSFNEENKYISFVTTRRKNEMTNNSIMSLFNDSHRLSSDCDMTVLSNFNVAESSEQNNEIISSNEQDINDIDNHEVAKNNVSNKNSNISIQNTERMELDPEELFITTRKSSIASKKSSLKPRKSSITTRRTTELLREDTSSNREFARKTYFDGKPGIVLQPGKKWERSLSIYRRMTLMTDQFDQSILEEESMETKGRKYRQSVINTMEMQEYNKGSLHNESINSRRSTFVSKPNRSTISILKDPSSSRLSVNNTTIFEDLKGFLNEECDDTIIELSKLSLADQTHEVTIIAIHDTTSSRITTARDYVLRRCNQKDVIEFDECYPETVLKNCHKIGEGVYGEVFLWRDRDGRARVLKIVPIAGDVKVNGESQKDFHEVISEIVIAMELSALRAPIAQIDRHFDEGKEVDALDLHAIQNATDVFNEVLAVRCVYGSYPSRLLDLWDLYDECKGSENDNPAVLPADQQYIVLELANAGQDLESYQFNNAEQAHALFLQVAYGLAVAEEAFQFEHRDLHWGNVLIAPTEQKYATFVIRGRAARVARCGVAATVIDYSLSRVALPLGPGGGADSAALYNDLAADDGLFDAVGDYQFEVYRLMREKLGNDWKNFAPYTNILWLHYTVDKMITALRYKRTNTKVHKHYINKLKGIKGRILEYGSAAQFVLTDNEI